LTFPSPSRGKKEKQVEIKLLFKKIKFCAMRERGIGKGVRAFDYLIANSVWVKIDSKDIVPASPPGSKFFSVIESTKIDSLLTCGGVMSLS